MDTKKDKVLQILKNLNISFDLYEHPPAPTIEEAQKYWKNIEATHCKNIFFRNHKGDRHYLVIIEHRANLAIHDLEKRLKQGKLSFASPQRMEKYLGVSPGSVSPFGLINDLNHHVHLFLDNHLLASEKISFHPNLNTYSVVISFEDFLRYLKWVGNSYEFLQLYD
ncbi:MAG TPA: prolyl-tRNA synthetase associated domain-containing protein [Bacteroidales bacterium]|mgnify:CR=1 FL=1|nr:prolyl-tRNA synthetase associated domain-containing protein [Bacteroidales bacterium]HPR56949.1 prolyl-tRNA synthetase associated domain-containing protein [Bacteroidales bacterium]